MIVRSLHRDVEYLARHHGIPLFAVYSIALIADELHLGGGGMHLALSPERERYLVEHGLYGYVRWVRQFRHIHLIADRCGMIAELVLEASDTPTAEPRPAGDDAGSPLYCAFNDSEH